MQGAGTIVLRLKSTVLGRGKDADVQLCDSYISRKHAKFVLSANSLVVTYLGSSKQFMKHNQHWIGTGESKTLAEGDFISLAKDEQKYKYKYTYSATNSSAKRQKTAHQTIPEEVKLAEVTDVWVEGQPAGQPQGEKMGLYLSQKGRRHEDRQVFARGDGVFLYYCSPNWCISKRVGVPKGHLRMKSTAVNPTSAAAAASSVNQEDSWQALEEASDAYAPAPHVVVKVATDEHKQQWWASVERAEQASEQAAADAAEATAAAAAAAAVVREAEEVAAAAVVQEAEEAAAREAAAGVSAQPSPEGGVDSAPSSSSGIIRSMGSSIGNFMGLVQKSFSGSSGGGGGDSGGASGGASGKGDATWLRDEKSEKEGNATGCNGSGGNGSGGNGSDSSEGEGGAEGTAASSGAKRTTPRKSAGNVLTFDDIGQEFQCAICQEIIAICHSLPCGHSFCGTCIDQWLQHKRECPMCKAKVATTLTHLLSPS
jgi:hypothetical protein